MLALKDWVKHDPLVSDTIKAAIKVQAESSPVLMKCHDICNGTKHLKLTTPRGGGARYDSTESVHIDGFVVGIDCWIDDGSGTLISGKWLARECIAEWERILQSHSLTTAGGS